MRVTALAHPMCPASAGNLDGSGEAIIRVPDVGEPHHASEAVRVAAGIYADRRYAAGVVTIDRTTRVAMGRARIADSFRLDDMASPDRDSIDSVPRIDTGKGDYPTPSTCRD